MQTSIRADRQKAGRQTCRLTLVRVTLERFSAKDCYFINTYIVGTGYINFTWLRLHYILPSLTILVTFTADFVIINNKLTLVLLQVCDFGSDSESAIFETVFI